MNRRATPTVVLQDWLAETGFAAGRLLRARLVESMQTTTALRYVLEGLLDGLTSEIVFVEPPAAQPLRSSPPN